MWLFFIFVTILICCEVPMLILVYASPFIIMGLMMFFCAIRNKIRYGKFFADAECRMKYYKKHGHF